MGRLGSCCFNRTNPFHGCPTEKCEKKSSDKPSRSILSKNLNNKMYKTTVLPVDLYGCETCSLVVREQHRLGVTENRMVITSGPNREK
jgi:hypothetical protein